MKRRLLRRVSVIPADRTGPPRQTPTAEARPALATAEPPRASRPVIALVRERPDGARGKARPPGAGRARAFHLLPLGQIERLREDQRAAIAVPEPVAGMDEHAERRRAQRLGLPAPTLERPIRRT